MNFIQNSVGTVAITYQNKISNA